MANKFLNGIEVSSSAVVDGGSLSTGSTILDVQGSQGQLFSVTNSLVGDLFSVSDISGVPILNVNSSGVSYFDSKVGIGIDNPTVMLQVDGNAYIGTGATDDNLSLRVYGNNAGASRYLELAHTNSSSSRVKTNNSYLSLESAGYILLSQSGLFYGDTLILNNKRIRYGESNGGWRDVMYLGTDNVFRIGTISTMSSGGDTAMYHSGSEKVRISSTGVGIGTTNPIGMLSVVNPISNTNTWTPTNNPDLWVSNAGTSNSYYAFGVTTNSGDVFSITNAGNVGIGTTSPGYTLEIAGPSTTSFAYQRTGVSANKWGFHSDNDATYWQNLTSGNLLFTLQNGGNVGINTTSPDFKLDVDGTFGVSDLPFNTDSVSVLVADEITGAELVTDGSFANGSTDWNGSFSIANGVATYDATAQKNLFQSETLTSGLTYKLKFTISNTTGTGGRIWFGNSAGSVNYFGGSYVYYVNGTYEKVFTMPSTQTSFCFYALGNGTPAGQAFDISGISIKQVTSASNQIQKRELGTGAFGPTPIGAYLPLTAGSGSPLTGHLFIDTPAGASQSGYALKLNKTNSSSQVQVGAEIFATPWPSNTNGGTIIFKNADSAANLQETLRISANGSVGINSTSSSYKLDVGGNARFQDSVYIDTSTGSGGLYVTRQGNANESLKIYTSDSTSVFETFQDENTGEYGSMAFILDNGAPDPSYVFRYGSIVRLKIEGGTGDVILKDALLSNQKNTNVDTGAEVVALVSTSTYTAAFFDFVIKKTTNVRSGTVYACHDGTNVEFTETSTNDLGDTSDVTLSVDISGGNMRLLATVTSDDWSVKSLIRAI